MDKQRPSNILRFWPILASLALTPTLIALPETAHAGCGTDDCSATTDTGTWSVICCVDMFARCRKYERRTVICADTGHFGAQYRLINSYMGSCDPSTKKCKNMYGEEEVDPTPPTGYPDPEPES